MTEDILYITYHERLMNGLCYCHIMTPSGPRTRTLTETELINHKTSLQYFREKDELLKKFKDILKSCSKKLKKINREVLTWKELEKNGWKKFNPGEFKKDQFHLLVYPKNLYTWGNVIITKNQVMLFCGNVNDIFELINVEKKLEINKEVAKNA